MRSGTSATIAAIPAIPAAQGIDADGTTPGAARPGRLDDIPGISRAVAQAIIAGTGWI